MDRTGWLIQTLLVGFLAFLTTNIDNLLLLILLFSQPNYRKRHVVAGQYLGFFVILLVSTLGFFGKFLLPLAWIGFLGFVPIILGLRRVRELLWKRTRKQEEAGTANTYVKAGMPQSFTRLVFTPFLNFQTYRVMLMTLGNGSDNIS